MNEKKSLDRYIEKMGRLRVDRNKKRYTTGKAPHKPTLLLSLITLHDKGKADLTNIKADLYLRETWSEMWNCLDYPRAGPIHLPMYHLRSDGFWDLRLKEGVIPNQPKSLNKLDHMVRKISLDENMIRYIDDKDSRDRIVSAILNGGYYSFDERNRLIDKMEELSGSFDYEEDLIRQVKREFTPEVQMGSGDLIPSRSPAFRRVVLGAYDETCAVCGMRLQTSSGISVIDAAHILPFNRFHNDDIRNGMALCKMHHWLFDRGILSVDDHYRILISKHIEREHPENIISRFHRQDAILPEEGDKYPHPTAIRWHRENVFDG